MTADAERAQVLVVRQFQYPLDPRVRREVATLLAAGHNVDVICQRGRGEARFERVGRLRVYRLPVSRWRGHPLAQLVEYLAFFVAAFVAVSVLHARRRYDVVQVNTLPDVLVFTALVPKLTGARVVIDLHECMPEFFATKFGVAMSSPLARVVAALEQASIRFADHAITCAVPQKEAFEGRGAAPGKIDVVLNGSDETVFSPAKARRAPDDAKFVIVCHGTIEERYGLDTIIDAVALVADDLPDVRARIIGDGSMRDELKQRAADLGIADRVEFSDGFLPLDELVDELGAADAGVVAMKRDAFRDLTLCNKLYDFVAMRKPAIVSRTRSVEVSFPPDAFALFEAGDAADLARAIRQVHDDAELRTALVDRARLAVETHRWPVQQPRYLAALGLSAG